MGLSGGGEGGNGGGEFSSPDSSGELSSSSSGSIYKDSSAVCFLLNLLAALKPARLNSKEVFLPGVVEETDVVRFLLPWSALE